MKLSLPLGPMLTKTKNDLGTEISRHGRTTDDGHNPILHCIRSSADTVNIKQGFRVTPKITQRVLLNLLYIHPLLCVLVGSVSGEVRLHHVNDRSQVPVMTSRVRN